MRKVIRCYHKPDIKKGSVTLVRIVTDSTCDLPPEIREMHGITVVPLYVRFGAKSFRDGVDINLQEFCSRLEDKGQFPATSQPSPADFLTAYEKIVEEGYAIISIHISRRLSGTVNSAQSARNLILEEKETATISIVDSLTASTGLGIMALEAAKMAEEGRGSDEIQKAIREMAAGNGGIALVSSLEHLHRGGRISRAKAFIGDILHMKPLIILQNGELVLHDQEMGVEAALRRMLEYLYDTCAGRQPETMAIITGTMRKERDWLQEMISRDYPHTEIITSEMGTVIGTHLGPESLVLMWH